MVEKKKQQKHPQGRGWCQRQRGQVLKNQSAHPEWEKKTVFNRGGGGKKDERQKNSCCKIKKFKMPKTSPGPQ